MKLFSDPPYTSLSMSCVNSFLRPNKLATISVTVVTDSPYLNCISNIYVNFFIS